ncbi:enoyl-CoA hydratase/isomerase family protein [Alteraurantiacibacter aquimixticola]|uniref:3-hydroxyisobutyryl-CoA hydrolase n=1 Tax=Alteraurantiacibacter aquimixticola TaxID=2489173 RepID=A0A4V4U8F2_9SPHN|nr:enoyl-CoA hydratase/isomerase family protein [Alteraurantiacibacter aquimixticola]TIX49690.1 enoyl-CoA hydratase/isomerase family protein [Alteraurantiacibacter aquimixticola]
MTGEIVKSREGEVGRVSLARKNALNALTMPMCEAMIAALLEWRADPAVKAVILDHADQVRGFCAGGDVAMVRRAVLEDGGAAGRVFFMTEYRLNHLLFTFPKPVIAFMDGVTMGGGVGLAMPAVIRVATENTLFAMPEGAIGLFPDVGAGYYLPRLPGQIGKFLALTGARLDGAECLWAGIATHYCASDDLAEAKELIAKEPGAAEEILRDLASPAPAARLAGNAALINSLFAPDTLEGIIAALEADDGKWAGKELKAVTSKCPTTAKVALRQFVSAPGTFAEEMAREYALAARMIARHDFVEGVRAVLVDKDGKPKWKPAHAEAVTEEMLDAIFAPLPAGEAWTPLEA